MVKIGDQEMNYSAKGLKDAITMTLTFTEDDPDLMMVVNAAQQWLRQLEHQEMRVCKTTGDYHFEGQVAVWFRKRNGAERLVVEDDRGLLLIMNPQQIKQVVPTTEEDSKS